MPLFDSFDFLLSFHPSSLWHQSKKRQWLFIDIKITLGAGTALIFGLCSYDAIMWYFCSGNMEHRFTCIHSNESETTLLPMSEHLNEFKKQHPSNLVISIFHTFVCICFMSQQRLISPTHRHRIIPCNKAQSQSPTKCKKGKSPKRKVTVTAISTGPNLTDQGGTNDSSSLP